MEGKVSSKDGSVDSLALEEFHLLQQKFHDIIRANPEKAITLNEKFRTILKEEEKEEEGSQFPVMSNQDSNQVRVSQPGGGQVKILHKRGAQLKMKMAKKEPVSKRKKNDKTKKKDQNVKSKKGKSVNPKEKRIDKKGNLDKKGKHISHENSNNPERQRRKKRKLISRMKQIKEKRKQTRKNRHKSKFVVKSEELENCTSLWAEFTNIGFGVATTLKKQVMDINLIIKVKSLAGKFHKKQ